MTKVIVVKIFSPECEKEYDHLAYQYTAIIEDILIDYFGAAGVETFGRWYAPCGNRFATVYGLAEDSLYYRVDSRFGIMKELVDSAKYFAPGYSIEVDSFLDIKTSLKMASS